MKFFLTLILLFIFVYSYSKNLEEPDLIKFYIEKGDYKNALSVINSARIDSSFSDSLNFFKALIYEKTNEKKKAIKIYSHLIISSRDTSLVQISKQRLLVSLQNYNTSFSIDVISTILDSLTNKNIRKDFLFELANIYERNLLYNEANDVYQTILSDTLNVDTLKILMNIALNDIYLKEFEKSRTILDSILTHFEKADTSNVLFLKAFTYYKEGNNNLANKIFTYLYQYYPNHEKRWEIVYYLSKTFENQKQYLIAWYLLNKLYKESNEIQKYKLYEEINKLKQKFITSKTATDQFKNFIPKWEIDEKINFQ